MGRFWKGSSDQLERFVIEDRLHQFTGIDARLGQRPGEPLRGGELTGCSLSPGVAPQADEAGNGAGPVVELLDGRPG